TRRQRSGLCLCDDRSVGAWRRKNGAEQTGVIATCRPNCARRGRNDDNERKIAGGINQNGGDAGRDDRRGFARDARTLRRRRARRCGGSRNKTRSGNGTRVPVAALYERRRRRSQIAVTDGTLAASPRSA